MTSAVLVLQGELTVCKSPVVKMISYDGHVIEKNLGESRVHLTGVRWSKSYTFSVLVAIY